MTAPSHRKPPSALKAWTRALELTAPIARDPGTTWPNIIDRLADQHENLPALASNRITLSYRALAERSNQCARWGLEHGLGKGDVIGLLMPNCPDYLAIWTGLTHIGATVALLNTNLTGSLLAHSINIVAPRYVVVDASLASAMHSAHPSVTSGARYCAVGAAVDDWPRLDLAALALDGSKLAADEFHPPALADRALYIYTSGTTGLPKAAIVSHFRVMQWSHWFAGLMQTRTDDRMFNCLPLYHSVGGVVATGATLVGGGTVVLRERFSVRDFWRDVVAERCTLFQYIGELCRYLLKAPADPDATRHQLRLCCGNGLRADVWDDFQQRFHIPQILEYYAATEGSFSLYNCEGRSGAIGRIPPFLSHRMPVVLIRHDDGTDQPTRDAAGRCVRCDTGEVGEAIGEISSAAGDSGRFEGYADVTATERKILRDVFAPGDAWYRTGDLMRKDEQGFFYFVDRVGDTFRWKGENVSTSEIASVVAAIDGVVDAVVYGVKIPGSDGRAGMVALVPTPNFDLSRFRAELAAHLPEYARPVFVRTVGTIELTGTFKLRVQELARQGYDPTAMTDSLFAEDRLQQCYVPLDADLYARIQRGELRF